MAKWKTIKKRLSFWLGVHLGTWYFHLLFATCRLKELGWDTVNTLRKEGVSGLMMFWHFVLMPPFYYCRKREIIPLIGLHRDAEILARIGERLGYNALRGSSNRRSKEALQKMMERIQEPGTIIALTPDGPRGPARMPKYGSLKIAQKYGASIYPVGIAYSRYKELNSWDRFRLVKPFSTIIIYWDEPFTIPSGHSSEEAARMVKERIDRAQEKAESLLKSRKRS